MSNDSMLDIYIYENEQLLEKLEALLLVCEKNESFSSEQVADIFRILHTIKGSSAMMNFDNIANLSHALEDLFDYLREHETRKDDHHKICDLGFETLDIINAEMIKIQQHGLPDGEVDAIIKEIKDLHGILTHRKTPPPEESTKETAIKNPTGLAAPCDDAHCYKATISFQNNCQMENIRAMGVVKSVENLCCKIVTSPADLFDEHSADEINLNGFVLYMLSDDSKEELLSLVQKTFFIENLEFEELPKSQIPLIFEDNDNDTEIIEDSKINAKISAVESSNSIKQNFMSVNLSKLDLLMDTVGEIVITESTVTKNPEITKLQLDSFEKSSRQLNKLIDELQDIVMSIRMVPVSATFLKMERIVRDMAGKVNKKAKLTIIGEDTELDKNILDNLSDPLMHIIRNSMDHGLETTEERIKNGKNPVGEIVLEARNTGGDVMIVISDDGRGLDKDKLIEKGIEKGLIKKPKSEVSDNEAYCLILNPGFSMKKEVTEFSGRGVGMDVVMKNIAKMGGSVSLNSTPGKGMTVQIRIPLTLAIIDGMQVVVGNESFIIPLLSIRESFKPNKKDIFTDTNGNENIHIRGECYPVTRIHTLFDVDTNITQLVDGILVIVEAETQTYCLFVDNLVGEQQTVVKPMPLYISKTLGRIKSIAGCTILGNGSISLILDINGLSR